jgi:hypothetical protein
MLGKAVWYSRPVRKTVVAARTLLKYSSSVGLLPATVYAAGMDILTSVRALSAERVRLEQDGKMVE